MPKRFTVFPQTQFKSPPRIEPWQAPPPDWTGSGAEWAVYWALTKLKVEFVYQYPLNGGRLNAGGQVADFYIPEDRLILRVMGIYFHHEKGGAITAMDDALRLTAEAQGYTVIDLEEDDCLKNPMYYVQEALEGREHSRSALRLT